MSEAKERVLNVYMSSSRNPNLSTEREGLIPCLPSCVPSGRVKVYLTLPWISLSPPSPTRTMLERGLHLFYRRLLTDELRSVCVEPEEIGRAHV